MRPPFVVDPAVTGERDGVDVAEHVQALEDLRATQARFTHMSAHLPGVVFQIDAESDCSAAFTYVSEGAHKVFGIPAEQFLGDYRMMLQLVHEDDRDSYVRSVAASVSSRTAWHWQGRVLTNDGQAKWVRIASQPEHQHGGHTRWNGLLLDVSDQVQAEMRRQDTEQQFRSLFEHNPDAVCSFDIDGRFTSANPACEILTGFAEAELIGQLFDAHLDAASIDSTRAHFASALAGNTARYETTCRNRSGRSIVVSATNLPIRVNDQVTGVFAIAQDVTEQRSLELQLRQAQRLESVGQLAGGVAHDFNNIITVIKAYGDFLLADAEAGSQHFDDLMEISKAADRAATLTRQLLAFSRKQMLVPRPLLINDVVRNVYGMLSRLIGEDVTVVHSLAPDAGVVLADLGQLEQVLTNLSVNARDAMPCGGRLHIETRSVILDGAHLEGPPMPISGQFVQLTVTDNGIGMSPDVLHHIFEPFFTTKEQGRGSGLGLATVYGIVKQSNGYISCVSEPGKGTSFTIYLPQISGAGAANNAQQLGSVAMEGATILVVEDETAVRAMTTRILARRGYTVLQAANGREALQQAADYAGGIDLLLTDAVMPVMGGVELSVQMQRVRPDIRILFMSGYTDDEMLRRGFTEQPASVLQKPFSASDLIGRVALMLADRRN